MLMSSSKRRSTDYIRKMVMIAMLSGISIFLGLTGLGFIPLGAIKVTIMHIPVIIGAIVEGPVVGASVGLIFGLFSMYQAFTAPLPTSFIFWNPIIALVPRILVGLVAYYLFKLISKKINEKLSIGISSVIATLVNTIGVLGLTYIIYLEKYAEALHVPTNAVAGLLIGVASTNGLMEALMSALIAIPVVVAVKKIRK